MKKISELVQYDFQKNIFYTVNKQTGQEQLSYKNGQKLKTFRPNITGQHYLLRRNQQKTEHFDRKSKIFKQKSVNQDQAFQDNPMFKVMNHTKKINKMGDTASHIMKETLYNSNNTHGQSLRKSLDKSRKGSIMNANDLESELSKEKSNQNIKKLQFNTTLRSFDKLLKEKSKQAKSPRNTIPVGYQQAKDPMQTLCTTLNTFRKKQYLLDLKLPRKSHTIQMGQQYSPISTFLHQRNLFYKKNPECKQRDDPNKIMAQKQRRRNLKVLQGLFINQNNKKTRSIYNFYK